MPGKKDKKKGDNSKKSRDGGGRGSGSDMASMFGFGGGGLDVSEADLEAELLALEGKSPAKGGKKPKSGGRGVMSMDELDKMMASADKMGDEEEEDDDEDLSDLDDDELLGELKELEDSPSMEMEVTPPEPSPKKIPSPSPRRPLNANSVPVPKSPSGGGAVGEVSERLELYKQAVEQAEVAGESSKARRYKRSITTLEQLLKSAKSGKAVNLEDMPPTVTLSIKQLTIVAPPTQARPHPAASKPPPKGPQSNLIDLDAPEFDEFNLTEEEFASMAASMVDDRMQCQTSSSQTSSSSSANMPQSGSSIAASHSGSIVASHSSSSAVSSHSSSKAGPPKPKPRSPPKPKPRDGGAQSSQSPSSKPNPLPMGTGGMLDLDDPMFDEFTLSEDDITAMAAMMDNSEAKKPRIDTSPTTSAYARTTPSTSQPSLQQPPPQAAPRGVKTAPPPPAQAASRGTRPAPFPPQAVMKSLPATLSKPMLETSNKQTLLSLLAERRKQYLEAAKVQKNAVKNKEYRLIAAQFSRVVKGVNDGQDIDLSKMPGPPPGYKSSFNVDTTKFSSPTVAAPPKPVTSPPKGQSSEAQAEEPDPPPNPEIPTPRTALEALEQRLTKYKEGQRTAEEKGESSRVRRMGRIIKQYESAIKDTKTGKPCDYEELPTPPGYPPIPAAKPHRQMAAVPLPTQSLPVRTMAQSSASKPSISQQQRVFVEQRMTELKRAAKIEQGKNNREGALEYLRKAKGLEVMLQASQSGLPVNLEQVPPSPFAELDKTKPSSEVMSHLRPAEENDVATFELIFKQLEKQVEICDKNADTYKKMGSSASAIEYENMSQNTQRELLALKGIQGGGYGPPKFTLETRTLTLIHSNAHLSSAVCEVEIAKAINLTCPPKYEEKDLDIYVEVEFPYPIEDPPKRSTDTVHKSCSPEFTEKSFLFDIDRKHHRSMARAFKRTPLKCTVWQHRSLRKHIYLGQVSVPLDSLETKSELHPTLDLLDEKGRKPVGGKLEVFVRLREPLAGRDQEEREEQWLVFKEAIAAKSAVPMPKLAPKTPPNKSGGAAGSTPNYSLLSPVKADSTISVAALKFEFSLVTSALKGGHKDGHTIQKGKLVKARIDSIQQRLQTDITFRKAYPKQVVKDIQQEQLLEAQLAKQGKSKQAEVVILQKRRAAMEKEVREMQGK